MPQDWSAELSRVNFRCAECKATFEAQPDLVEPDAAAEHHPFRYFAHCPSCGAKNQPQVNWERALMKAHQLSTGPKSPEGIKATAANLKGHPTPDEALRTRFNAMKHGLTARTATYFPAKPGRYSFCKACDVDRTWCGEQPACVKQTEIFLLHHAAFEQRDPKVLGRLHADLQASLTATLQMCIQEVLGDGVIIRQPRVELDRDGTPVTLTYLDEAGARQYIWNYQSHPAFKPITELVSRLGLSMNDLGMTVRTAEADEGLMPGRLNDGDDNRETLAEFGRRMLEAQIRAREQIAAAQERKKADPVLIEHQAQGNDR